MNIYEYQAKNLFNKFGITIPTGKIAYTPQEAQEVALKISPNGPWVVKAQIQAGSRFIGKFADKRAGSKGGIRLSKTIEEVYTNADEMLENMLITSQTGRKGRLVSRVYVEEYVKTTQKFYLGFAIDRVSASVVLLVAPLKEQIDGDIVHLAMQNSNDILKIDLGSHRTITSRQLAQVIDFIKFKHSPLQLQKFLNKALKLFYSYDALLLEINPMGYDKDGKIWALDAKIIFDSNALYRHKDILKLNNDVGIEERESIAEKYGFQYEELENGIGIITNGSGLAFSIINEARGQGLNTACFLNLKGGADRDKIAASIKLIMTNPKVDGIFINILGGFSRCNLIADGIITVANDLGLNIPLVARFEGTNREEAINILQSSGLPLKIVPDTITGLSALKTAIKEDL